MFINKLNRANVGKFWGTAWDFTKEIAKEVAKDRAQKEIINMLKGRSPLYQRENRLQKEVLD